MKKLRSYWFYILPFIILILCTSGVRAQVSAGPDDTITAGVPVRLSAVYGSYATPVVISDDGVEGPFPIGFPFGFFGKTYTQFYIGANGWISFLPNQNAAGTRAAFSIPSPDLKNPKACILGPFQDMQPEGGHFIYYQTTGDSLSRKLTVMWCQTPMFSEFCSDSLVTFQIILYEGSNRIENMIMKKPACIDWMNNIATLGIQDESGFTGFTVPGRNATSWSAYSEGWRYTPVSADSFAVAPAAYRLEPIVPEDKISYAWYKGAEYISSDQSIVVTPNETTQYHVVVKICQGDEFTDTVNVFVVPFVPNAFTPDNDGLNDVFRMTGLPVANITQFSFSIYDRWGRMVFNTNDVTEGWNGAWNGKECPAGAYAWILIYNNEKKTITNKGVITLVR